MLNGRQLRTLFQQFNQQYFGGKLPAYSIRVVGRMTWLGESGFCNRKRKLIKIASGQSDEVAIGILLHEMAHAATTDHHGKPWQGEMIRLREAGAPIDAADLDVESEWDGLKLSKKRFRGAVQDFLMDRPDITPSQAIKHFIWSYGGAGTVTEFLKNYSWAVAVFKDEKKANDRINRLQKELRNKIAQGKP
jgi:SprT-like family